MVKSIVFLKRRTDMSQEAFHAHWRDNHAPLVLKLPGVRRYVQNRPAKIGTHEPPYDGVAEVWFEDLDSLKRAVRTPAWQAILADEKNFMGHTTQQAVALTVEEDEIAVSPTRG